MLLNLEKDNRRILEKQDLYKYQLNELDEIELYPDIYSEISSEYEKIANIYKIKKL